MIKKRFCALLTIWPQDGDKRAAELLGELNKATIILSPFLEQ